MLLAVQFLGAVHYMPTCLHVVTFAVYTSPFYIDAFVGSQKVKTVEDSVAGDLDIFHCSENKQLVFIWKTDSTYFL